MAMRKMWVIAAREYNSAVRTKAFIIGLLLMPLLMGGSIIMQVLFKDVRDTRTKHFAVVDRTPSAEVFDKLKKQLSPLFELHKEEPAQNVDEQRWELSEKVRKGELFGFLDIGRDALTAEPGPIDPKTGKPQAINKYAEVRYQSNRPTFLDFSQLADKAVNDAALEERAKNMGKSFEELQKAAAPVPFVSKGLTTRDAKGNPKDATEESRIAAFLVPFILTLLMFMVIMMSATPLMQGVVEEKMQRIAEVLLGSVSPFQLMMGKLIGMTGVSLTIMAVYLGGGLLSAKHFGVTEFISPGLVLAFLGFQALAALMFGSLFIAVGAACTDMKETQNLLMPIMLLACLPMFVMMSVLQEPNGPVATGLSYFPFATPTLMIARMAVPPGIPWWQPVVGVVITLVTTVLCVFAAGRIFRVGILMQGKGARLSEIVRWVLKG
jgi:ABC-2 type transport system permease protein